MKNCYRISSESKTVIFGNVIFVLPGFSSAVRVLHPPIGIRNLLRGGSPILLQFHFSQSEKICSRSFQTNLFHSNSFKLILCSTFSSRPPSANFSEWISRLSEFISIISPSSIIIKFCVQFSSANREKLLMRKHELCEERVLCAEFSNKMRKKVKWEKFFLLLRIKETPN